MDVLKHLEHPSSVGKCCCRPGVGRVGFRQFDPQDDRCAEQEVRAAMKTGRPCCVDLRIRPYKMLDEPAVVALWTACGLVVPWNDPQRDIRRKLDVQPDLFLVGTLGGKVVGTVMAGYEGHRGWINYLAVSPQHRRAGIGRRMMAEAETALRAAGCPKINLQVRETNSAVIEFYRSIGFAEDRVVSLGKRLVSDEA